MLFSFCIQEKKEGEEDKENKKNKQNKKNKNKKKEKKNTTVRHKQRGKEMVAEKRNPTAARKPRPDCHMPLSCYNRSWSHPSFSCALGTWGDL